MRLRGGEIMSTLRRVVDLAEQVIKDLNYWERQLLNTGELLLSEEKGRQAGAIQMLIDAVVEMHSAVDAIDELTENLTQLQKALDEA
jgi:hypothetical protein